MGDERPSFEGQWVGTGVPPSPPDSTSDTALDCAQIMSVGWAAATVVLVVTTVGGASGHLPDQYVYAALLTTVPLAAMEVVEYAAGATNDE